jgi:methyl-accepting chemotaxis protein
VVEESAKGSQETSQAAGQLTQLAEDLHAQVNHFRLAA